MRALSTIGKGYRTLMGVVAFIVTGLLSVAGMVDLTPLVALFVKDPAYLGAVMVVVGMVFGFARYMTTTPIMQPHRASYGVDEAPELKRGMDAGA